MEKKSSIIAIGLTIHNAPVELREKLAVPEAEWPRAIQELCAYPHIEEAAVLSTCNRMEIYVVGLSFHRGVREVEEWMSRASGVPLEELRPYLFLLRDRDATGHLLRVSGGLDSLVMGEGQILAQVKQVHKVGQNCPGFGRHLNGLFKQAVTAGKRVRTETSISSGAVSVSSAAAELAQLKLPTHAFADARVCIIGAGKMSRLLVKHLASKGCSRVTVLNRSLPRAEALAEEFPEVEFDIRLMPDLMACVADSDVVFAASGSEELLVHPEDLAGMPVAPAAVGGVRRFVDISVPRNIAPGITAEAHGAVVYNVDDLKEVVAANKEGRAEAAREAEVLLGEEQLAFEAWRDSLETVPTIKALRGKAEAIRAVELERTLNKLGEGLSNKQKKAVEELSKGIVNKLLHGPMTALRCDGADASAVSQTLANMEALERMFELAAAIEADRLAAAAGSTK
jgi:glutamyl-tRNA reductase